MAQTILIKRSNTSGAVPTTSQLSVGELALNTRDGKIYMRKYVDGTTTNDTITLIGDNSTIAATTLTGNLSMGDNVRAIFGTGNDLQIYHDGSNSYINENGTGDLIIKGGGTLRLQGSASTELANFSTGAGVTLFHNNVSKFATTSTGINVTGTVQATVLSAASTYTSIIYGGASSLQLKSNTSEMFAEFNNNGNAELYYDNSKKFETTNTGIDVTGSVVADEIKVGATERIYLDGGSNTYIQESASDDLRFFVGGQQAVRVRTFGTDILGTVTADGLTVNSGGNSSNLSIRNGSNNSFLNIYSDLNGVALLDVDGANVGAAPRFQIDVGNVQTFRIQEGGDISFYDSSGTSQNLFWDSSASSLGIGTTVPARPLTVNGLAGFRNSTTGFGTSDGFDIGVGGSDAYIVQRENANIIIETNGAERLRIKGDGSSVFSGNVTANNLYVADDIGHSGDSDTYISFDNNTHTYYAGGTRLLDFAPGSVIFNEGGGDVDFRVEGVGSSHALFVQGSDSKVGIGTSSPSSTLHVKTGNIQANIRVDSNGTNAAVFFANPGTNFGIWGFNSARLSLATSGTERMSIDSTGNVGIGKTSPSAKLDIEDSSGATLFMGDTNGRNLRFRTANSGGQGTNISSYAGLFLGGADNQNHVLIDGNGKVIIGDGASHTDDLLQIETPASGGGHGIQIRRNDANTDQQIGRILFGNNTDTDLAQIAAKTDGDSNAGDSGALFFSTQPTGGALSERMRIDSSGNVGIGTTTPGDYYADNLVVASADDGGLTLASSATTHKAFLAWADGTSGSAAYQGYLAYDHNNNSLQIATAATERMRIDSAGSIGFNTSNPLRPFDSRNAIQIFGSGGYTELMLRGRAGTAQNLGAFHFSIRSDVGGDNDDLMLLRFTGGNSPSYAGTSMHIRNDNGHVGIGTNTGQPSSLLHVVGGSATIPTLSSSYPLTISNNGNSGLNIISSGTANAGQINFGDSGDADAGRIRYDHNDNSMRFTTNATEYMRITSAGRVSVGTSTPARTFHVVSSDYSVARLERTGSGGGVSLEFRNGDGNIWGVSNDGDEVLRFYYAGVNRLQVTSGGAVRFNSAFTFPTTDGSANQLLKTDGSGNMSWVTVSGAGTSSYIADADGDTKIQVEENSDEDKIRFDANGVEIVRMGFNSSSESTLEIVRNGVPAAQGQLTFNGSGLVTNVASGYHSLIVKNGSSEHLRVRSNGNVGIGESSPGQKLQVNGNIRADGHYYVGGQIVIDSNRRILAADGAANVPYITFAADTNTGLYRPGTDILGFSTAGSERVRIDASGNVGIGTTAPNNKLTVTGGSDGINIQGTSSYLRWNSGDMMIRNEGSYAMGFHTYDGSSAQVERMRITSAGNVGIGTASPGAPLVVNSTSASEGLRVQRNGSSNQYLSLHNSTNYEMCIDAVCPNGSPKNMRIFNTSTGSDSVIRFGTSNAEKMRLDSNGNVGIGTTSPSGISGAKILEIKNSSTGTGTHAQITLTGSNGHTNLLLASGDDSTGGDPVISSTANHAIRFGHSTNSAFSGFGEHMRITDTGNVGIGTASPNAYSNQRVLTINGTTHGRIDFETGGTLRGSIYGDSGSLNIDAGGNYTRFYTGNTEKMRLDASGNLLVGQSAQVSPGFGNTQVGSGIKQNGNAAFSRIGNSTQPTLMINKNTNDGIIASFQKDGTAVGSIGTVAGDIVIGTGACGIRFHDGTPAIQPRNTNGNANNDAIDIGLAGNRFKDLYLSRRVNFGGVAGNHFAGYDGVTDCLQLAAKTFVRFQTGTNYDEAARIDSSGRLLIGTTSTTPGFSTTNGHAFHVGDASHMSRDGGVALIVNRGTSDGGIAQFRKSGTFIGDIGVADGDNLFISGGVANHAGLKFGTLAFIPIVAGSNSDNTVNLGMTSYRFHDAHFGGTVNVGENLVVTGNLTINGTTTTLNTATLNVEDKNITLNYGSGDTSSTADGAGITIQDAVNGTTDASLTWRASDDKFIFSHPLRMFNTLELPDNVKMVAGDGNDLQIYHDGSNSYIQHGNTGNFNITTAAGTEFALVAQNNGSVFLYHDGTAKFQTTSGGASVTGALSVSGNLSTGFFEIGDDSTTTTATTQVAIAAFAASSVRSCKLLVQVTNTTDSTYHFTEVSIIHNGTTAFMTEYGTMFTGSAAEAAFTADISSGSVRLLATPASTDSMTFKVVRQMITV